MCLREWVSVCVCTCWAYGNQSPDYSAFNAKNKFSFWNQSLFLFLKFSPAHRQNVFEFLWCKLLAERPKNTRLCHAHIYVVSTVVVVRAASSALTYAVYASTALSGANIDEQLLFLFWLPRELRSFWVEKCSVRSFDVIIFAEIASRCQCENTCKDDDDDDDDQNEKKRKQWNIKKSRSRWQK